MFHNPMPIIFALYFLAAGIALYEGIHSALIGMHGYRRPLYTSFALACLCAAIFQMVSACLYAADSKAFVDSVFRFQIVAAALFVIPFAVFVMLYTGQAPSKPLVAALTMLFGGIAAVVAFSSYGMRFSALEFSTPLVMPWGEKLNQFSAIIGGPGWTLRSISWAVLLWALCRARIQFRRGEQRSSLFLAICIMLLFFSTIWGVLIDLGMLRSIYLEGFAYLGFVLLMNFSLSLDIRSHSLRLTTTIADLEKTQTELRQSELRLRNLGDRLPDSYLYEYSHDMHGRPKFLYLSSGVERLHGITAAEVLSDAGRLFAQIVPQQLSSYLAAEAASERSMTGFAMDLRMCRADGQCRWFQMRSTPRRNGAGRVVWDGAATDITERIALMQALESNNAMLRRINYTQQHFIAADDPLDCFDYLLQQLLEATGSKFGLIGEVLSDAAGKPYLKTYAVSNIAWNEATRRLYDENAGYGLEFRNLDGLFGAVVACGETVIANDLKNDARVLRNPDGHPPLSAFMGIPIYCGDAVVGMAGLADRPGGYDAGVANALAQYLTTCATMIDAYRNKRIRREAEAALLLHASVFENAWEGITITDAQCNIISVNEAFIRMTGYSRDEILGKNPRILNSGRQDAAFYKAMWESINASGHWRGEVWNRKKNGALYAEILTISAVKNAQGEVCNYVGIFADITDLKITQQRLEYLANYDPLTGLPNRILLADRMQQNLAQAKRSETLLAVCFMDLDGFKPVNDKHGHETGDRLLAAVAERLSGAVRSGDTVSRLGGDEFVILLVNIADMDEIGTSMTRILDAVAAPFIVDNLKLHVSASLGLTIYPLDNADCDALLRHADSAMYEAKQTGRNRFHLFDAGLDLEVQIRRQLLQRLGIALKQNEFRLYYQPKVNLRSGEVIGMEALLRWQHPERGILRPAEFLPLAESTDIIIEIGAWVIDNVLAQIRHWRQQGLEMQVSINIAARQLQHPNFLSDLDEILAKYPDVPSSLLELEILETAALETEQCAQVVRNAYKQLGVAFALDDFGTGYSTLAYLKRLPVKMLKIDQSFVRDMLDDRENQAIIAGIVQLAKVFRRRVIAEGVETGRHASKLLEMGCDLAQGYGIAPPLPAEEIINWRYLPDAKHA
jgi:diguanylate cyclase (GGDEF)-like protein/PAS domain S-box-containing protein